MNRNLKTYVVSNQVILGSATAIAIFIDEELANKFVNSCNSYLRLSVEWKEIYKAEYADIIAILPKVFFQQGDYSVSSFEITSVPLIVSTKSSDDIIHFLKDWVTSALPKYSAIDDIVDELELPTLEALYEFEDTPVPNNAMYLDIEDWQDDVECGDSAEEVLVYFDQTYAIDFLLKASDIVALGDRTKAIAATKVGTAVDYRLHGLSNDGDLIGHGKSIPIYEADNEAITEI